MTLPALRRFNVDEYYEMARAGILGRDDRVQLIEGEIIEMPAIGNRPAAFVARLTRLLITRLGEAARVRVKSPVRLSEYSEPEPDLAVVKPRSDFYVGAHPVPEDILLLIEVADSTIRFDRSVKIPLYAHSGIPEVWLLNVEREIVEVSRDPARGVYQSVQVHRRGERIDIQAFPELSLAVDEILG